MGNCIAPCTSELAVSTEASGGLNQQPLHSVSGNPVGENNKNGRNEQKRGDRIRSRSSERKEADDLSSLNPEVSCKNPGGGTVRVKLVIRKQDLAELLANGLAKKAAMEDLLVELQAKLGDQSTAVYNPARMSSQSGWRPSLESIPEDKNTHN